MQATYAGAQQVLPPEGRIVYQVSSASTDPLDTRPVVREFHVTYNESYIREEFIDEPHRFTLTNRQTQRKRYAAGYFENIPVEIEEDVSPQQFHTVESVQLRSIAGLASQLYIVFVNNRWTDIFVHASPVLSYPEILGLNGLATEFSMPSEHGIQHYRVSRVEAVNFEDEWFSFETLHRISPASALKPVKPAATEGTLNIRTFEQSRDRALELIDKVQEAGSLRRLLAHGTPDERYDRALESERKLRDQLIAEDYRLRSMVDEFRSAQEGRSMDAEALSFLSEAARTRRIIAHVIETAETDLKQAQTASTAKRSTSERPARTKEESTPAMSWRSTTAPPAEVKPEDAKETIIKPSAEELPQGSRDQRLPDPRAVIGEEQGEPEIMRETVKSGENVQQRAINQEFPEQVMEEKLIPEDVPGRRIVETFEDVSLQLEQVVSEEQELSTHDAGIVEPVAVDASRETVEAENIGKQETERLEQARSSRQEESSGFVSLMDFVNRQAHTDRGENAAEVAPVATLNNVSSTAYVQGIYMDGRTFSLGDYRGKVVVLNFWFIACRPCIVEIPKLNELIKEYENRDVEFIAFALDGQDRLEDFLRRYPFDYSIVPSAVDIAAQFGVSTYPTHIILDREGNIVLAENGFTDHVRRKMTETIKKALGN